MILLRGERLSVGLTMTAVTVLSNDDITNYNASQPASQSVSQDDLTIWSGAQLRKVSGSSWTSTRTSQARQSRRGMKLWRERKLGVRRHLIVGRKLNYRLKNNQVSLQSSVSMSMFNFKLQTEIDQPTHNGNYLEDQLGFEGEIQNNLILK